MSDITKCTNDKCSRRNTCHRWTAPSDSLRQSFAQFKPTSDVAFEFNCDHFWLNSFEEQKDDTD